jgi:hypothetical protein
MPHSPEVCSCGLLVDFAAVPTTFHSQHGVNICNQKSVFQDHGPELSSRTPMLIIPKVASGPVFAERERSRRTVMRNKAGIGSRRSEGRISKRVSRRRYIIDRHQGENCGVLAIMERMSWDWPKQREKRELTISPY